MNVPLLLLPKVSTEYLSAGASVKDAIEKLRASGYAAIPVLYDNGRYCGTISSSDILAYILDKGDGSVFPVKDVHICDILPASSNPPVNIDASLHELLDRLMESNFAPVVDGRGCFVGIVTRKKLLSYLQKNCISCDWNTKTEA